MTEFEGVIGAFLAKRMHDERWLTSTTARIGGGSSNLTYLVCCAAGEVIVRRPPFGVTLPTAHDMAREHRVLSALAHTAVPVPRTILVSTPEEDLGVSCLVMERVVGPVCRDCLPDGYADGPRDRHQVGLGIVDTLADLHAVDPDKIGLADFGRPGGFLQRQLRRWSDQWSRTASHRSPALDRLSARLCAEIPQVQRTAVVHGDFRLDNVVLHPAQPGRIAAVLDWEMSTLGDPLADLGALLTYWSDPDDDDLLISARVVPPVTAAAGFPSRADVIERYAARTGLDIGRIGWYRGFSCLKLAVICQGVSARVAAGAMGAGVADLSHAVEPLARAGLRMIERVGVG